MRERMLSMRAPAELYNMMRRCQQDLFAALICSRGSSLSCEPEDRGSPRQWGWSDSGTTGDLQESSSCLD